MTATIAMVHAIDSGSAAGAAGLREHPADRLFGPFRALFDAGLTAAQVQDLYTGDGARLYDVLVTPVAADIAPFIRVARITGGPVMDLACGSGRLTFPLAQRGLEVTGVDLSCDMLALLRERTAREAPEVRERITVLRADMAALDELPRLPENGFGLITLAATSIVLLHRSADRRRLFSAVARRLRPGGRFAFDVLAHDLSELDARPERYSVMRHRGPHGGEAATLMGQRFERTPEGRTELVNMLTESIDQPGAPRQLTSTRKAVFVLDELATELAGAGLQVVRRTPATGARGVVFLECAASSTSPQTIRDRERR